LTFQKFGAQVPEQVPATVPGLGPGSHVTVVGSQFEPTSVRQSLSHVPQELTLLVSHIAPLELDPDVELLVDDELDPPVEELDPPVDEELAPLLDEAAPPLPEELPDDDAELG
jgi:hypothetical protein